GTPESPLGFGSACAAEASAKLALGQRARKPSWSTGSRTTPQWRVPRARYVLLVLARHVMLGDSSMKQESHGTKTLRLALIGMSGAGKTFWTKKLAESDRFSISCDDRIEQRLVPR